MRPHLRPLCLLALGGLFVLALAGSPIRQPGTMDSHYYYASGRSLLQNRALVEPYIWNYLDDPTGLPTPSHLYWMPLPSMLVAAAQWIVGPSFKAAQIPFLLLAAGLPLITYATSWALSHNRRHALVAGLLTIFSGFYLPYWTIPETFAPYAFLGGLTLYAIGRWTEHPGGRLWPLAIGLLAGLGHLCRADGVLLLLVAIPFTAAIRSSARPRTRLPPVLLLLAGYLLVMGPWFFRNWQIMGAPLSSAGAKTVFLRSYDELFSYGTPLTLERYLAWGWGNILRSKLDAGWANLQTFVVVNNLIFLTPLCLIGAWRVRRRRFIWPSLAFGVMLYGTMALIFTFPGARGGVFHSSAALLPAIFAVSMVGLDAAVEWAARRRPRWNPHAAKRFFSVGIVLLAAGMTGFIYHGKVVGNGSWTDPAWNHTDSAMIEVGDWLQTQKAGEPVVMVGNPPAFHYHTGLQAIVIPNEGVERTLQAARRYGAGYLVLDQNRPEPLAALYEGNETHPTLPVVWGAAMGGPHDVVVFRILRVQ
jgi:4-amino-4-deoxy-L-arabinose transferase-like glycosyltransferase